MNRSVLTAVLSRERHSLFLRGNILVFTGYSIAMIETFIAIGLGITAISVLQTMIVSTLVLTVTIIITAVVYFKKRLYVWQEWAFFSTHVFFYLISYSLWVYWLNDLRILAMFNSLMAIIIVLSYTGPVQSLMMSMGTLTCHIAVIVYVFESSGITDSLERELFISLCLFPAFILVSASAWYIQKQSNELLETQIDLEKRNRDLNNLNDILEHEHSMSVREMELANVIQSAIFPSSAPETKDWEIAFISKPKNGISGDFYDFYCTGENLQGISLFDVSGHGAAPALITILSKPVLFRNFRENMSKPLGHVAELTNTDLFEKLDQVNIYITGILLRMNKGNVEYSNAGHHDLLMYNPRSNKVTAISENDNSFKGFPLGISSAFAGSSVEFEVSKGDFLLLYSDCLSECRNNSEEQYGSERIRESFLSAPVDSADTVLGHILSEFDKFVCSEDLSDDLTIIVARKL